MTFGQRLSKEESVQTHVRKVHDYGYLQRQMFGHVLVLETKKMIKEMQSANIILVKQQTAKKIGKIPSPRKHTNCTEKKQNIQKEKHSNNI